ncbi:MAG TPA: ABC transporter permease, partial [Allosphingosinicella sp.]
RRDFIATVYTRSFILFMLTPLLVLGFSLLIGYLSAQSDVDDIPVVAVATDSATAEALNNARAHLVSLTSERSFPVLRRIDPADNVRAQARILLADEEAGLSALLSGTLEQPVLSGPERIDEFVGERMALLVEQAQRNAALTAASPDFRPAGIQRDITGEAVGNLREMRTAVARFGQFIVFFFTLLLATMLLSNLIEEKSNKVIEVLAAAVPLDAIFLGKLLAMLAVSLVGIALWGGVFALAAVFSVQLLPQGMELPSISPAVGWGVYAILLPIYYTTNYMLLGSLFLGIGAQANSVREVQTLNMPVTFMQMGVFVLAMTVVGSQGGMLPMVAYIFPFSSPLAMMAEAGQSPELWPHLLAIAWQALWVFLIIRISASLFRRTVLKSGGEMRIMPRLSLGRRRG